ncbi:MAG: gamma-glutamylcyclotransferase, partial [Alphaproteobacteria bacterium]|nr:gamma-glutamylcyclotransferase [Alphaproteobacteria bacterium]
AGGCRRTGGGAGCTGRVVGAFAFGGNPGHHRLGGKVPVGAAVHTLATAEGRLGRCRDYLHNLVLHLDDLGLADGQMHRLYKLVESHSGQV